MHAQPAPELKWLEQLLGDWTFEHIASMSPGEPEKTYGGGKETVRSLGGMWFVGESTMPGPAADGKDGDTHHMLITLGFDPAKKKYVGSWVGSMMPLLWTYEGTLDPTGRILSLESEGPSFEDPTKTSLYRDTIEFTADGKRKFSSSVRGPDGTWTTFMKANYERA